MRFKKSPTYFAQYAGLKVACWCLRILPYNTAIAVGRFATGAATKIMRKRFERNIKDISLAFPEKSPLQVKEIAYKSWQNMGQILAEVVKLSSYSKEAFKKRVEIRGLEILKENQKNKVGGIIHIGHFTNWEAFGMAVSVEGLEKAVLAQRQDNPYVDEETNRLRNTFGGTTFHSNHDANPFPACVRWIKKGKMIGILTDQNILSTDFFMNFLGRPSAMSPITALLSIRLQVPVIPVVVKRENGKIICQVETPIIPPTEYSPENVRLFMRRLTDIYESWIRQKPENWLWAHNRWKRENEARKWLEENPQCVP